MNDLLKGAYDLHVHSAPDVLPRKMDDIEMAQRVIEAGMAGYVIKSHYFPTSERAHLIRKMYPKCNCLGSVTLNSSVGGINPSAVEMAGRSGAKIVWFPTCDAEHERAHVFGGDPNKKLPYWAQIIIQLKEAGIHTPTISILDGGKLKKEVFEVLDIIASHNMILATGHLSHEEAFALVDAGCERKVKRIIITHADFPTTNYTVEEQKAFIQKGAVIEHCYTTWATGKSEFETVAQHIKAVGVEHVILSTDLGQKDALYPDEGLKIFAERLIKEGGFSEADIQKMVARNPAALIA
ncbi:MAG: DUF6282 family protein [Spirochaetes bacterium]|nr:DUF6282 family protein [Spirochaetota bacterium]